jgi:hemerythrin-like domain-containing protein
MKSTEQLSREHRAILRALDLLASAAASWRSDPANGALEDCGALLDFFKTFADRCHHGKEERVLFPKLMEAGIRVEDGPLGVMLYEHDKGRQLIRSMDEALTNAHPVDFSFYANQYTQLLKDHIAKEDNILFSRAEWILTDKDDEALLRRFDEIEREMGEGTHERFHHLLDKLAARYLSRTAKVS